MEIDDVRRVERFIDLWYAAVAAGDREWLESHTADDFHGFHLAAQRVITRTDFLNIEEAIEAVEHEVKSLVTYRAGKDIVAFSTIEERASFRSFASLSEDICASLVSLGIARSGEIADQLAGGSVRGWIQVLRESSEGLQLLLHVPLGSV